MSSYSEGQTHLLMDALEVAGFTPADITKLGQWGNRLNELRFVLNGRSKIVSVPREPLATAESEPEPIIDPIIRIDRSVSPAYPDWVKKLLHPELEKTGPVEYDASKLEQWLHKGQKGGKTIKVQKIYEHLKKEKMLEGCIGLADLLEIQKKGIVFFRKHFKGKAVFGWKSVVLHIDDHLRAPALYESGVQVVLHWYWLNGSSYSATPICVSQVLKTKSL